MEVTTKTLDAFGESLAERGLGEGTIRLYRVLIHACADDAKGMTGRLTAGELAPKSLRTNRAALLAWADFAQDDKLAGKVRRIRLPPAVRAKPKLPLERKDWKALIHAIRTTAELDDDPAMRAVLFLIAVRGLRTSDALRIRRSEVSSALRTGRLSFEAKGRRRLEYDAAPIREALTMLSQVKGQWTQVQDLLVTEKCTSRGAKQRFAAYARVSRSLRHLAKALKIRDVHGHRFRRTYATNFLMLMKGDPQALIKLQQHLGWASPATAMQYVDAVNRDELDKVGTDLTKEILG